MFRCSYCKVGLLKPYDYCPACQNRGPQKALDILNSAEGDRLRQAIRENDTEWIAKHLTRAVREGFQCPRCHLYKYPKDLCCFDEKGHLRREIYS